MITIKHLGTGLRDQALIVMSFTDWVEIASNLPTIESPLLCIFVANAEEIPAKTIGHTMLSLLQLGCNTIACWGPDCERVHDIFDEELVMMDIDLSTGAEKSPKTDNSQQPILSTWHSRDELDDVLWHAFQSAMTDIRDVPTKTVLAICQDNADWLQTVETAFRDPIMFCEDHIRLDNDGNED